MLKTRLTEMLGIQYPIMLAGMNWITTPQLVSAVCNAGGLGVFATAACTPEETRRQIREIRSLTDKPFGINQILIGPGAKENIAVAIEEKVPIINYSLGKPWFIDQVHAYGGKVMGTIAVARHAVRAAQLGCDLLVVTGHEAAAHGDVATSLVLIPLVAGLVKVPLIAAGGFYDGRGLAAALVLGADGISMGTRFIVTRESRVHENFKKLILKATEQDTLYADVFDGMPGRVLKSPGAEAIMKSGLSLSQSVRSALEVRRILNLPFSKFMALSWSMMKSEEGKSLLMQARQANGAVQHLKAIREGDEKEGFLFAGQCVGGIQDMPTCKELIERVVAEAENRMEAVGKASKIS
ncbi:MAG: nitronate monooxygenase [Deltaproteobacteria bacterium]|nr:nitronate monooxygenase [Deltaproteobacteria bacterium]